MALLTWINGARGTGEIRDGDTVRVDLDATADRLTVTRGWPEVPHGSMWLATGPWKCNVAPCG